MKNFNKIIKKLIEEVVDEITSTGSIAGYQTPFAFRRKGRGKNSATKYTEKLGFTVDKKHLEEENEDLHSLKKLRKKIFQNINEEFDTLDIAGSVINPIKTKAQEIETEEKGKINQLEDQYKNELLKINGKFAKIIAHKGDPYQTVKEYLIKVSDVEVVEWSRGGINNNYYVKLSGKEVNSSTGRELGEIHNYYIDHTSPNHLTIGDSLKGIDSVSPKSPSNPVQKTKSVKPTPTTKIGKEIER